MVQTYSEFVRDLLEVMDGSAVGVEGPRHRNGAHIFEVPQEHHLVGVEDQGFGVLRVDGTGYCICKLGILNTNLLILDLQSVR